MLLEHHGVNPLISCSGSVVFTHFVVVVVYAPKFRNSSVCTPINNTENRHENDTIQSKCFANKMQPISSFDPFYF